MAAQLQPGGRADVSRPRQAHVTQVLPSLDLLRSVAIVAVVTAHTVLAFGAPVGLAPLQLGGRGVDLFFVLSGWLLGKQLMVGSAFREFGDHGRAGNADRGRC